MGQALTKSSVKENGRSIQVAKHNSVSLNRRIGMISESILLSGLSVSVRGNKR